MIQTLAATPFNEAPQWSAQLEKIAAAPLELCPQFPLVTRRFEAWWEQQCLDRPILIASANTDPSRPITRRLELLDEPEEWFAAKVADMNQRHWSEDAVPHVRVDFGAVFLTALQGGTLEFGSDTTWYHTRIDDDWNNAPDGLIHEDSIWWQRLRDMLRLVSADAAGRYLVRSPSFGGSADVLLNLRGSQALCMDAIEQPQRIVEALSTIYPAWRRAFAELYNGTVMQGAGLVHWLGLWSNVPCIVNECDFNFMIGPNEFNEIFLPDIARQAADVGRAVFHLDGPGAARHIDALLEIPQMRAIQFTPGEGAPSALPWLEMFRKVQARGKSLLIIAPPSEVLLLCDELRPEGLAFLIDAAMSVDELDELSARLGRKFGVGEN